MRVIRVPSEPKFVGSAVIPDNDDPADDKVYFFFTERVSDVEGGGKAVHTRVARVCAVSIKEGDGKQTHPALPGSKCYSINY